MVFSQIPTVGAEGGDEDQGDEGDQADQPRGPEQQVLVADLGQREHSHCPGFWRTWEMTSATAAQRVNAATPSAQPALTSLR